MLKVKHAMLACSAVKRDQYPEVLPSIVLFGRSNAGKSSLINTLINRKNLARTSSAPGKTRLLNFYCIQGSVDETRLTWYFVDLPGYGYAKVSRTERDQWLKMMQTFLASPGEKMCWQLVDIRHQPSEQDVQMQEVLRKSGYPLVTVANKCDKISKNERAKSVKRIAETLAIDAKEIVSFSAVNKEGMDRLLAIAEQFLLEQAALTPPLL